MGVFEAFIALFGAETGDIRTYPFPKFVASRHLMNPSPENFPTKIFPYFLYELLTANSNTLSPLVFTNVVTFRQ